MRLTRLPTITTAPRKSPVLFRNGKMPAGAVHMPVAITTGDQTCSCPSNVTKDLTEVREVTYNGDPGKKFGVLPSTLLDKGGMVSLAPGQVSREFFEAPPDLLYPLVRNVEVEEGLFDDPQRGQ